MVTSNMDLCRFALLVTVVALAPSPCATARDRDTMARRSRSLQFLRFDQDLSKVSAVDFRVGTQTGTANVVSSFNVVGTWASGNDLASNATETVASTIFFLRASGGSLQLAAATVAPANVPHLQTSLSGLLVTELQQNSNANLKDGEERRLSVVYNCRSQGKASLTLTLEFQGLSPVQIPFKKTCGGEQNTALTVTVGSATNGEKVTVMGMPRWDELKVVGVQPMWTNFTVFVDPLSQKGPQVISTPIAKGIGSCAATASLPSMSQRTLQLNDVLDVPVKYRCFRQGSCIVSVEVPFHPNMAPYQPTRWSWTKLCGGSALGIDVRGEKGKGDEKTRLLATDGAANRTRATPWLVEDDTDKNKIFLINDQSRSLDPQVRIRSLRVRCLDSARCEARMSEKVPQFLTANSPLELNIEYDCRTSGSSIVQLLLATEGHNPVIATWAKDCAAFSDSIPGVLLSSLLSCCCIALACIGLVKIFGDKGKDDGAEFVEDDNLSEEEITALNHYEEFYGLQHGSASIEQVRDNVWGVHGWAAKKYEGGSAPGTGQSLAEA